MQVFINRYALDTLFSETLVSLVSDSLLQTVALHLQSQIPTDSTSHTLRCTKLSCGLQARSSPFGDVTRCVLVTSDRRFGTDHRPHIQGSIQDFDCLCRHEQLNILLKHAMGSITLTIT